MSLKSRKSKKNIKQKLRFSNEVEVSFIDGSSNLAELSDSGMSDEELSASYVASESVSYQNGGAKTMNGGIEQGDAVFHEEREVVVDGEVSSVDYLCLFVLVVVLVLLYLSFVCQELFTLATIGYFTTQLKSEGSVPPVVIAGLAGLFCTLFSWSITFEDSLQPGVSPPTPLSPTISRPPGVSKLHCSYIMCFVNGLCFFLYFILTPGTSNTGGF